MLYRIENDFLQVAVSDLGAELQSILGKKSGTEYLWQGDPAYWAGRAPVLFPVCGRLTGGEYLWQGKTYRMDIHGFLARTVLTVEQNDGTSVSFLCRADEQTRAIYPFEFEFHLTYTLTGNALRCLYTVVNTGAGELPFSFGGHPGFNVPFVPGEPFEDYYLEFDRPFSPHLLEITPDGFLSGKELPFSLRDGRIIPLRHELFDPDGLFFRDPCHKVSLRSLRNDRSVTVQFDDMNYLGFWQDGKAASPFLCIEPWHGICPVAGKVDDFATKAEMVRLPAGKTYSTWFDIRVDE